MTASLQDLFQRLQAARPNPPPLSDQEQALLSSWLKTTPVSFSEQQRAAKGDSAAKERVTWRSFLKLVEEYNRGLRKNSHSRNDPRTLSQADPPQCPGTIREPTRHPPPGSVEDEFRKGQNHDLLAQSAKVANLLPSEIDVVQAIDELVEFVKDQGQEISRPAMVRFRELAERVYVLAVRKGIDRALPQMADLARLLDVPGMRPVWFEGKVNLPGDWVGENFLHLARFRWVEDMAALRALAAAQTTDGAPLPSAIGPVMPAECADESDDNLTCRAIEELADAELPSTPDELLTACQKIRRSQIKPQPGDSPAPIYRAHAVVAWLWDAMRMMGGAVPIQPAIPFRTRGQVFADLICKETAEERKREFLGAIDLVTEWALARTGKGERTGAFCNQEAGQGEGNSGVSAPAGLADEEMRAGEQAGALTSRPSDTLDRKHHPTPPLASTPPIDPEAQALALLFQHPEWSITQIADYLKVDRKTPYKWQKFRQAAEQSGKLKPRKVKDRYPRRGHKTRDGQVEAYNDQDQGE